MTEEVADLVKHLWIGRGEFAVDLSRHILLNCLTAREIYLIRIFPDPWD